MNSQNRYAERRLSVRAIAWLLTILMCLGLLPVNTVVPISATGTGVEDRGKSLSEEEANMLLAGSGRTLVEIALENNFLGADTIEHGLCGGSSHLQGICVDDKMEYMYFSYTSALAKVDIASGELVASIGGFGQGSFGTAGGAHLGCLDYYDGWVYGSLEYKSPGQKFFVAAFDTSKMTEIGVSINDEDFDTSMVTGMLMEEPTEDFRDVMGTELYPATYTYTPEGGSKQTLWKAVEMTKTTATNEVNNGHKFACSGIDGVTFGTYPGDTSGKIYLIVAYGVYGGGTYNYRYDNMYNVLNFYALDRFWDGTAPTGTQNIPFNYKRGLESNYTDEEVLSADKTLYVFTGNTSYGSQNIEYEWDTKDIVLYTYGNTDGFGKTMYVIDGSKAPENKTLELGQNCTVTTTWGAIMSQGVLSGVTEETQEAYNAVYKEWTETYLTVADYAKDVAKKYATDANGNAEIEADEYPKGDVAFLKCICGNESSHSADTVGDAYWTGTTLKKADQPVCSLAQHKTATTGVHWLGPDPDDDSVDYFYIADGSYEASLYKRTTAANGKMTYETVLPQIDTTAKELLHYSMDAEDLYVDDDGNVRLKNSTGDGYDAIVEGTTAATGVGGGEGSSLSFDAWKYPSQVDRVYLDKDTISYINQEIDAKLGYGNYSYSFWAKMPVAKESDGNFIPFIGFYREDGTYASVFEKRWRAAMAHITNGIGSAAPGAGNISSSTYNPSNSDPGDQRAYFGSSSTVYPKDSGWHFYTVTENCGEVTVYYDGVQITSKTVTSTHLQTEPFAAFEIGGSVEKLWQDMNNRGRYIGEIDDVTIYSGVLTAEQVAAAYASKPADASTNPVHPGVDVSVPTAAEFSPKYPVYDKTADANTTLTVTANKAVAEVFTLDSSKVTISNQTMTFSTSYLGSLDCGIHNLTVKYSDNTTSTLKLTVTDQQIPVLNYSMDSGSVKDSVVKDSSNYGVDAVTTVKEFGGSHNGISNGSMVFDGYDYNEPTYMKLSDENAEWLNSVLKSGYTINFWANATAENGNKMAFLGLYAEDGRPVGAVETYDTNETTGNNSKIDGVMTIRSHIGASGTSSEAALSGTTVKKNEWAMYTISYSETSGLTLYIDGVQVANTTITADVLGQIDQFYIGHQYQKYYYNNTSSNRDWTTRGGFYGNMDNVSVYNYVLSAEEIAKLLEGASITPAQKTKPMVHWTMDANTLSGDGTIAESSNGYTSYYQNVTPVAGVDGKEGGALYFNGAADSGEAARVWLGEEGIEAVNGDVSNQVTMTFWMKADTTKTNEQLAYTAAWSPVAGIYGTDTRFLMVAEYRGGKLNYCATIPGLSDQRINQNVVNPANDQWHFVVMTWDGNATETVKGTSSVLRRIYVYKPDGSVVVGTPDRAATSTLAATKNIFDAIGHIEIGGQNSKGYWSDTNVRGRFVGAIDDVKIYNVPFTQEDTLVMYQNTPATNNELYLDDYQFDVKISDTEDLRFNVANAGELTKVSRLSSSDFSMENGVVTLDHDAVADLGLGQNLVTLTFANGTRTIRITVEDDREYFNADTVIFDKAAPTDMNFSIKTSFGSEIKSISAEGLTADDYTVNGRTVTVSKDWLVQQQPGAVEFTVVVASGETRVMTIHVTNTLTNETTEPYPVLYYKMDEDDFVVGEPPVNGAVAGTILDQSGNGVNLRYGGLTTSGTNKNSTADSAAFFDGYRDYDVSRAWLDDAGMEYLKSTVSDEITISFWHSSPRITSNYMPALGLFAENDRPLLMVDFRTSGGERSGTGKATNPSLVSVPNGSVTLTDGEVKDPSTVTMNSTWHHYAVTYNNTDGTAKLYVDGAEKASATLSTGQLDGVAKFEIGGMSNAEYYDLGSASSHTMSTQTHGRLYGYLDEVRVYNTVLTAEDIADVYALDVDDDLPEDSTGVKNLTSVELTTVPTKTEYKVGDELDVTGGKLTLTYDDNTTKVIDVTADMVSGFDSNLGAEEQVLTVSYTHKDVTKTTTYKVKVVKAVESIVISAMPEKVTYEVNEALDLTGSKIKVTYDDATTEVIDISEDMTSGYDSSKGGAVMVTVTYGGKSTTFGVTVGKKLDGIAVTTVPKTEYKVGDELDVTNGKITLTYDDATTEVVDLAADMVSGFDSSKGVESQTLTISYTVNGVTETTTYNVTIVKTLTKIEVSTEPNKTVYEIDDTLDVTGGKLTLTYDDATTEEIDLVADMVSGFDSSQTGELTLTITYEEKTAVLKVSVGKKLESIAVTIAPKTEYRVGEVLDVTGGKVTLTYDDKSTDVIDLTTDMISGFDSNLGVDEQELTVTCIVEGVTRSTTYTVKVVKELVSIALTGMPKIEYKVGDELDVTGGKLTLTYDDNTTKVIDLSAEMISGFDSAKGVDEQTLTISYTEDGVTRTTTYTVSIIKVLQSILVSAVPSKLAYEVGDELDVTGGKLTLTYDDETKEVIDMTPDMVSGFNSSKGGAILLNINYEGKETTLGVTIGKRLNGIELIASPKTEYGINGTLDVTGGKVKLNYNDGTSEELDLVEGMVSGFDSTKDGTVTLTITYGDFTDTYDIVVKKALKSITVKDMKKTYRVNSSLDIEGALVVRVYDDGSEDTVELTADMVSGFDSSSLGANNVTITYGGKTVTLELTIRAASSSSSTTGTTAPIVSTQDKETEETVITETTAKPSTTVKDNTATSDITDSIGEEIVNQAVENESHEVIIAPEVKEETTKTEVSIPVETIGKINEQTDANLTVSTPVADVVIPNSGLADLAGEEGTVTVTAEVTGNTVTVGISTSSGKSVKEVTGGIAVTVPVENVKAGTVAVVVREDGSREVVRKSVTDGSSMTVTVPLTGSSTVEIVDNSKEFTDMDGHWSKDAVDFASSRELFSGVGDGKFGPDTSMNRAMMATVFHNLENNPDHEHNDTFHDVHENRYYAIPVEWAASNGVVSGYGDGSYRPYDVITREQLAVMLWNYSGKPGSVKDLDFGDTDEISGYAQEAMRWAVEKGVMAGRTNGNLDPRGNATRAEVAQMFKNYIERVGL